MGGPGSGRIPKSDADAADRAEREAAVRAMREAASRANEAERERREIMARWIRENPQNAVEAPPIRPSELDQIKAELRVMLAGTDSAAALERLIEILEGESKEFALSASRNETFASTMLHATTDLIEKIKAKDAALAQAARELQEARTST